MMKLQHSSLFLISIVSLLLNMIFSLFVVVVFFFFSQKLKLLLSQDKDILGTADLGITDLNENCTKCTKTLPQHIWIHLSCRSLFSVFQNSILHITGLLFSFVPLRGAMILERTFTMINRKIAQTQKLLPNHIFSGTMQLCKIKSITM